MMAKAFFWTISIMRILCPPAVENRGSKLKGGPDTGLEDFEELVLGSTERFESDKHPQFFRSSLADITYMGCPAEVTGKSDSK